MTESTRQAPANRGVDRPKDAEHRSAEELLHEREQGWVDAFNSLDDLMMITNMDYAVERMNDYGMRLLGKTREEVIGAKCYQVVHGLDTPCEVCPVKRMLMTGKVESADRYEKAFERHFSIKSSPIFNDRGEIVRFVDLMRDITTQKRGEEALREAEETWRSLLENIPDFIITVDRDHRILTVNRGVTGITVEQIVGTKVYNYVEPAHHDVMRRALDKVFHTGTSERYKVLGTGPKGPNTALYETRVFPNQRDDQTVSVTLISSDITERKQTEEDVRVFKAISDRAGYGTAITDLEGCLIYVNEAFARMHGYAGDELVGKNRAIFHTEEQMKRVEWLQERLKREGNYVVEEVWHKRKDGTVFPVLMNGTLIRDEEEKPLFIAATAVDVTERKQAEEELVRLSTAVKMSRDSIVISDLDGIIVDVNEATVMRYGSDNKEELLGKNAFDLIAPEDREKALAGTRETLEKGYIEGREYNVVAKDDGRVPVEMSVAVMKDGKGRPTGFVAISRDITERKRREEEVKRRLMRFKLDDGILYLVKERVPVLSLEAFKDLLKAGYRGFVISRTPEAEFKKDVEGNVTFRWLAERGGENAIAPDIEALKRLVDSLPRKAVLFFERLDYVFLKNGFQDSVSFVQYLRETALLRGSIVILSLDPSALSDRAVRLVEKETREVEPRVVVRLSEDLLELVRLVYEHNAVGVKPNHAYIGQALSISKPTVSKRINRLITAGYVTENVKGSSKVVELTQKGMRLFVT